MKLLGIDIERYGRWERFSQQFHPSGVTVVYGPNEAGKTTLLKFIRGVLFGFPPDERPENRQRSKRIPQGGSLTVEHQGQAYQVHRSGYPNEPGLMSIRGVDAGTRTARLLEEMVSATDGKLFETVFAVGLPELQQFATLHDDEVARHLYGMTLGPQGALLMDLPSRIQNELKSLWDAPQDAGAMRNLLKRREELIRQQAQHFTRRNRYRELLRRQKELAGKLSEQRRRQTDLQQNLRGLSFTERVWSPWQRLRELRREHATLPDFSAFPADGIKQLARFDHEINAASQQIEVQTTALRDLQFRIAKCGKGPEVRKYGRSIRRLMDERPEIRDIEQRLADLNQGSSTLNRDLQTLLSRLGPKWTLTRIDQLRLGAEGTAQLTAAAREYQAVHWQAKRNQRWYKRLSATCRDRELAVQTEWQNLGATADDFDNSLRMAIQRLAQLTELGRLQAASAALKERSQTLDHHLAQLYERMGLPDWAYALLGFFCVSGIGLFIAGMARGISTGWLVGLIYLALSATVIGTAWALKYHADRDLEWQVARLREHRRELQEQTAELDKRILELLDLLGVPRPKNPKLLSQSDTDLITQAARRIAGLEATQLEWQKLRRFRSRLSVMRGKMQTRQREMSLARANWCRAVTSLGLDETVDIDAAFRQFQTAWELVDGRRRWRIFEAEADACRSRIELFTRQIEELGRRMKREPIPRGGALAALDQWHQQLEAAIAGRREVRELRLQFRDARRELNELKQRRQAWDQDRTALLKTAGVTHRAQFEDRLALMDRRKQVESLLAQTERELDLMSQTEPDLALVEDDLIQYQPAKHKSRVEAAQQDLQQTEQSLLATSEQLGNVRRELQDLEADRSDRRTYSASQQMQRTLDDAVEQWFGKALGADAVESVCIQFEQTHQPETLAAAIPYLRELTCGKYQRLWTALGRRQLYVDDEIGRPWAAEQLSGGTREQLFLSIRLAMVRSLARHGVELPMVLDDVTVNFDNDRSEAAVETLLKFSEEGQQVVVLTSHRHFAQMFQNRGIDPIWLPPSAGVDLEERRAG